MKYVKLIFYFICFGFTYSIKIKNIQRNKMENITVTATPVVLDDNSFRIIVKNSISYVVSIAMVIVMLSMGCTFDINIFIKQAKRPIGIFVCLMCQFIIFPLVCFGVTHLLHMDQYSSISLMILSSSPGGTLSNILCFWAGGDITLSISMTTISTAVAIGMMPLNLWVYGRTWESSGIKVPVLQIFIILILLVIPAAIGVLIKHKLPKIARWITKIGSVVGFIFIILSIIVNVIAFPGIVRQSLEVYMIALAMPVLAFILGFNIAWLFRQRLEQRIAIAFEICFQSIGISIAVISISFSVEIFVKLIFFCQLYGITVIVDGLALSAICRLLARCSAKKQKCRLQDEAGPENEALQYTGLTELTETAPNDTDIPYKSSELLV